MDVVITYVDCNDEAFINEYNKYVKKELKLSRYRSYGVLDLQVKLIRKFMPYIENIFIVVSSLSQVKDIDLEGCKIITHDQIIPKEYLPCFNSCTIEMFLHKIPELNEQFIYFNDDVFIIDKISKYDLFRNGKPCLHPKIKESENSNAIYSVNCKNATKLVSSKLKKDNLYKDKTVYYEHIFKPMTINSYKNIWSRCNMEIKTSLTRTRNSKNFNTNLFSNYEVFSENYVDLKHKYHYISLEMNPINIKNMIGLREKPIICINDSIYDYNFEEAKKKIREVLNWILSKKDNEKYISEKEIKEEIILDGTPLKVALCAIAKNENLYIREWVEWYKNIGISKIFLYDNNEINGERFEYVINDYIEDGFVEIIDVRGIEKGCVYDEEGINLQPKCYIDCYENKLKTFDWVCFFDVDEFLSFKDDWNLIKFLSQDKFNDTDTILIPWLMFTDNNLIYYESKPVVNRFTTPVYDIKVGMKSIVKANLYFDSFYKTYDCLIHEFLPYKNCKCKFNNGVLVTFDNTKHNLWKNKIVTKNDICVLNHYKTKSTEEYLTRHLGRHWGTCIERSKNKKSIEECKKEYFKYNTYTIEKESFFNTFEINKDRIIITLTTYPKRDKYIYDVLNNLKYQTKKPDKIYLFLAEEEYNKDNLPNSIKKCIEEELCEIKWTYNSYCHKRHEIFKYEYNSYVMTIDDDMYYPNTYIEELYNYSKTHNCICEYVGFYDNYENTKRIPKSNNYNITNLSGATICFPPKSFPIDCLNYNEIRDKICPTCDESWIQAFLLKENKKIIFLHNWNDRNKLFKTFENSQEITMHKIMSNKNNDDIRFREQCFANVIKFLEIENIINKIWPQFNIDKCSTIKVLKNDKYKILINKDNGNVINTSYLKNEINNYNETLKYLNLNNPITINEKINWLKVYDVLNIKAKCADKILIHDYCKEKLGKDICIPIIKIYDSPDQINLNELPNKFVLKCNHGYKMNIICKDKYLFNLTEAKEKCKKWLSDDFGLRTLQLHYSLIDRKCFIEKYVTNGEVGLTDYKFWCQNGIPYFVIVINDRYNGKDKIHANIYDLNWNKYDVGWKTFKTNYDLLDKKPQTFDLMINYAKKLSEDFKFVRVDFYEINGQCYLGELTFTPDNGLFHFDKDKELYYGNLLTL